ncbi:RIP metalloprotease RseP [Pseudochryseolinea flava]|uniref:Zinc metalloprotease n=1 Tax=Pseudochryseolinea flava TaxID=2059302 RepID=A0A364XVQ0_9BACT|nr:RIP metalloprotease RseP [Pseudochryseolinea flava]RAV98407.1 RIP metalloprotease RseP [Pseudochryseolinea flava]
MEWMISLAQLLLSLSFLVAVHEFGHLLAAKYFGMRVEQFSIGFPPKIWSFKKGETEYALSAIPLGGYVKISGMIDESLDTETMKRDPQPWEFRSKPAWQRLIVMLGGIFVNVVIGILIFIGLTFIYGDVNYKKEVANERGGFAAGPLATKLGIQSGDKILKINGKDYKYIEELYSVSNFLADSASYTIERDGKILTIDIPKGFISEFGKGGGAPYFLMPRFSTVIDTVLSGKIADSLGLKKGDRILELQGTAVQYNDQVQKITRSFEGDTLRFSVLRGSDTIAFVTPFKAGRQIGYAPSSKHLKDAEVITHYSFGESIPLGTERAFGTLFDQITAFKKMITRELPVADSLSGPIGIMDAFGTEWNWERFWKLTGVLSLVLAFMNLLPIPALDGGHVMFLGYEIITRRKPSDKFLENAQKVGMIILLALMVFVFANDIIKKVNKWRGNTTVSK